MGALGSAPGGFQRGLRVTGDLEQEASSESKSSGYCHLNIKKTEQYKTKIIAKHMFLLCFALESLFEALKAWTLRSLSRLLSLSRRAGLKMQSRIVH